tara:strand:- start:16481 stop:16918 length:438 start_codon:yes stop_codon:yes gene_type:complete
MKTLYKLIFLVYLILASTSTSIAQSLSGKFNINMTVGLHLIFNANINCEFQITNNSYIALGYGEIAGIFGDQIPHIDITHIFLKGKNNHYMEFGYGLTAVGTIDQSELLPNFRLGYRKINDFNSRFFRTGISMAEGLYLGFGLAF